MENNKEDFEMGTIHRDDVATALCDELGIPAKQAISLGNSLTDDEMEDVIDKFMHDCFEYFFWGALAKNAKAVIDERENK